MKSVLISIQPYYVFLIIARLMGWVIPQEKTIEVRKDFPKDPAWNKRVQIYCSKNKKSFNRIPKQYQPLMEKFLGKVIGEFVCDRIEKIEPCFEYYSDGYDIDDDMLTETCLTRAELMSYGKGKPLYGWHISDLKIYDKPKELGEFKKACGLGTGCEDCDDIYFTNCRNALTRPSQSWCYVEKP